MSYIPLVSAPEGPGRHLKASDVVVQAFLEKTGRAPTLEERIIAQAVGLGEGNYGVWKNIGVTHNWGAIQAGKPPCGEGTFSTLDFNPNINSKYEACFYRDETSLAGAKRLLNTLYFGNSAQKFKTLEAAKRGNVFDVAERMYDAGYYQGHSPIREKAINGYVSFLQRHINEILRETNEKPNLRFVPGGRKNTKSATASLLVVGASTLILVATLTTVKKNGLL